MFIVGNFLIAVAAILNFVLNVLLLLVVIRAVISWVNPDPYNPIVQILHRTTDPLLEPIRRRMPPMPIDFSPMIVWVIIIFLQAFLVASLRDMGYHMRQSRERSVDVIELLDDRPTKVKEERIF